MDTKLFIGNLSDDTAEEDLRSLFSQAGTVVSIQLIRDRDTGGSKGFAFVEMGSQAEADHAVRMYNGYRLSQTNIKVARARTQVEDSPHGNGNGGQSKEGGSEYRNWRDTD